MKTFGVALLISGFGLLAVPCAWAADVPPDDALPLSELLASVPGAIAEAEFDDGLWEVKSCDAEACDKRYLDPHSGEELRRKDKRRQRTLPAGAEPTALDLVQRLEAAGVGIITEIEFDHGYWEVKLAVPVQAD